MWVFCAHHFTLFVYTNRPCENIFPAVIQFSFFNFLLFRLKASIGSWINISSNVTMFSLFPIFEMVNWLLYWIEALCKANISPRFFIQSRKYCKGSYKITMMTTNCEVQFYDCWQCRLQMRACCPSGKTSFLSEEETWTLPNAESDTEHEPPEREVEL